MQEPELPITELLQRFAAGDRELGQLIAAAIGPKLHELAHRAASRERSPQALRATEVVNEVWLSLLLKGRTVIQSRQHFFALAAQVIRHLLVNEARKRLAISRGGGTERLALEEMTVEPEAPKAADPETVIEIDRLMDQLENEDSTLARILEMRYFCGFTREEIAEETGLKAHRVRELERKANEWMHRRLQGSRRGGNAGAGR